MVPAAIRREADRLDITWSADHVGHYPARELRLACPCAACVDEMTGRPLLDPATVPEEVRAAGIQPVGAYGIKIQWSDGHGTGIYTYRFLLDRCPCAACAGRG
jgi:DUF971 family protein